MSDGLLTLKVSPEMVNILNTLAEKNDLSVDGVIRYGIALMSAATQAEEEGDAIAIVSEREPKIRYLLIVDSLD